MTSIAFIGLGIMGSPMAVHLAKAGHDVVGYNRTPDKTKPLVDAGGRAAASVADAVSGAEVVAVMVPDSPDVREVLAGDGGVFANGKPGTLIIDFSSHPPRCHRRTRRTGCGAGLPADRRAGLRRRGRRRSTPRCRSWSAARAEDFADAQPILDVVGKTVVHVGPNGSGQTVKAANQLIVAANIQVLAEAVIFLEAYGVDTAAALKVLGGGLAGSKVLDQKGQKMLDRSFDPGFRIELHHKDLGIVTSAAREAGVVIPVGALLAQLMASAKAVGDGGLDHSALLRGVERLSGR